MNQNFGASRARIAQPNTHRTVQARVRIHISELGAIRCAKKVLRVTQRVSPTPRQVAHIIFLLPTKAFASTTVPSDATQAGLVSIVSLSVWTAFMVVVISPMELVIVSKDITVTCATLLVPAGAQATTVSANRMAHVIATMASLATIVA